MEKMHKCKYCGALLSETNSVFVHISRFDDRGKSSKSHWMCCKCWDNTRIQVPYYKLDQLPDPECTVKIKDNARICGNCSHLILKDYHHQDGTCRILRIHRDFKSPCIHEEENND